MTTPQGPAEIDKSLRDVKDALDVLTATLGEVRGCEYPRLIAREIQALIVACVAHERTRYTTVNGLPTPLEPAGIPVMTPPAPDTVRLLAMLEEREAEISRLRDIVHHGVDTIEAHTLTTSDGTAVMLHGDYQCVSAAAIEQWLDRAVAVLNSPPTPELRA